ncbi:MAG: RpoL/Rpb11 RNA polymerase subunit family protein [Nanoarchaeota archaeon]|nr:RpoL/Rpb11 RNA polymerase subunit family protein [Nanoarchaeota archaeon]
MEIKVLKKEKNEIELEIGNLTIAEILRVYLNKDSTVTFVAWKREHITKNPILKVKTASKDVKSVIDKTVKNMISDVEKLETDFKKLK